MYFCNNNKCLGLSKFNHGSLFKLLMAMHERITKLRQHFFTFGSKEITLTNMGSNNPRVESKCFLRSHIRNSNTKYNFASSWSMCSKQTTLGWSLSSLSNEISRTAVLGIPSSASSRRIFFKATSLFVFLFRPLYTTPYVPGHKQDSISFRQIVWAVSNEKSKTKDKEDTSVSNFHGCAF